MVTATSSIEIGGQTIAYSDTGGSGAPVLLAHGFGLDNTMFAAQADLSPEWRIIAWDSRGHGGSPAGDKPFTFWDLADDQLALMDALGIETAAIGGVSQGGFTALRTALRAPERVSSLLLLDTEAGSLDPGDAESYAGLFAALEQHGPIPDLVVPLATQIVGEHPAAAEWARIWGERGVPLGAATQCLTGRDDIVGRLPEITAPALVLRGELDASIPADRTQILHDGLSRATEIQVVAGAWHSPPITHGPEVNAILRAFLSGELPVGG